MVPTGVRAAQVRCTVGERPAGTEDLVLLGEQTGSHYLVTSRLRYLHARPRNAVCP